jgi:diguanylate cyclase (GGDEF)-like protein
MSLKYKAVLLGVAIAFLIVCAAGLGVWLDYVRVKEQSEASASDVTRVVEKQIMDSVYQVDVLLEQVAKTMREDGSTKKYTTPEKWQELGTYCRSIMGCVVMGVVAKNGRAISMSNISGPPNMDVSDREFFQAPIRSKKLYIDSAIISRLPGRPIIFNISKPVFDQSGKLLAVIAVGMNTEQFTALYQLMGSQLSPVVTVLKMNGDIVARNPDMASNVGKSNNKGQLFTEYLPKAPHGVYESKSVLDGKIRVAAYRSLPTLDLVVFAGIEKHVAFQAWKKRTYNSIAIVSVLLLLLMVMLNFSYRSLVSQLALRVKNDELEELSLLDGLTGVANRRSFDMTAEKNWQHHLNNKTPLSVLMIDIDFFKYYNDSLGHQAGDECLRKIAQVLKKCLYRDVDQYARYGGEEFVVIVSGEDQGALKIAQRICNEIDLLTIAHPNSQVSSYVTVSVGIASTNIVEVDKFEDLLRAADNALYLAKEKGRNRVEVCGTQKTKLTLASSQERA